MPAIILGIFYFLLMKGYRREADDEGYALSIGESQAAKCGTEAVHLHMEHVLIRGPYTCGPCKGLVTSIFSARVGVEEPYDTRTGEVYSTKI